MSTTPTHIVLGGNGVAGRETLRALSERGIAPVSVGRTPSPDLDVRSVIADLRDPDAVENALKGADVAYLTAGLPYSDWETMWPRMLDNSINACLANGTLLVYLDNVYAYGRVVGSMTETSEIRPVSRKGRVRAAALSMLEEAARSHGLVHTVGRSADFYGPGATTSVFNIFVVDKVVAGKRPTWFFDATQRHSLTYTADIGEALVILGTDPRARGRTWHLPTASPALTGEEYMSMVTGSVGGHHTMSALTMRIGALFNRSARETLEMSYQYTEAYRFDSSAFETTFDMTATPYAEGISDTLAAYRDARRSPRQ
ncbi:MAG TPA: NAD-dependent epimerase/dehydratase family protein [Dermatophilaceae bacterium]|nr:NAD-dependent epimerase/dehydratase family protein [Dermatophilaceae bacterium]